MIKNKFLSINKILLLLYCCIVALSCTKEEERVEKDKFTKLDHLIMDGFSMQLEQIYVMPGANTIPILDKPVDSLLVTDRTVVNLPNFQTLNYMGDYTCRGLRKNDVWNIDYYEYETGEYCWELGYASNYMIVCASASTAQGITITSNNELNNFNWFSRIRIDKNINNYRGKDNHVFGIRIMKVTPAGAMQIEASYQSGWYEIRYDTTYSTETKVEEQLTNLHLEVLTDFDGLAHGIDDGYLYLNTSAMVQMEAKITEPLTGDQVKIMIKNGDYELYPIVINGIAYTAIKIGYNLYLPRYNSYVYVGTTNEQGMIFSQGYRRWYYQFKFKII
jgi:hypothetical protein